MNAAVALADWYATALTASVELPDGWFGRPYDNMHRLTGADFRDDKIFVELDGQLHLILADPLVTNNEPGEFELRCGHVVFDWCDFGAVGSRHPRLFHDGGRVCFHASGV